MIDSLKSEAPTLPLYDTSSAHLSLSVCARFNGHGTIKEVSRCQAAPLGLMGLWDPSSITVSSTNYCHISSLKLLKHASQFFFFSFFWLLILCCTLCLWYMLIPRIPMTWKWIYHIYSLFFTNTKYIVTSLIFCYLPCVLDLLCVPSFANWVLETGASLRALKFYAILLLQY